MKEIDLTQTPAFVNALQGENAALESNKKRRKMMTLIVIGIIWSFIYTAVGLFVMLEMSGQANQTCQQFSDSREMVRALILSDPDFNMATVDMVSDALPPIVCD